MGSENRIFGKARKWGWKFWLWFFGIFGAIAMLYPASVLMAIMMMITIPFAFVLVAAPFLFIVLSLTRIIGQLAGGGFAKHMLAAIFVLALSAVIPFFQNAKLDRQARTFSAADHNHLVGPLKVPVLAVRQAMTINRLGDGAECDEFCARVLLTGSADQIIYADIPENAESVTAAIFTVSFRLEKRSSCPEVALKNGGQSIRIEEEHALGSRNPIDLLKIAVASGNCLIEERAPLSAADAILTSQRVISGKSGFSAGLDPWADTVSADRLMVHLREGNTFREVYRWTGVSVYKLAPLLIPTVVSSGMDFDRAFLRLIDRVNISSEFYLEPDFSGFVTKTLGMKLALDQTQSDDNERSILLNAMADAAPIPPATLQLAETFINSLVHMRSAQRQAGMSPEDRDLAVKLLSDVRVPVPFASWAVVKNAGPAPQDYFDRIGEGLFARLQRIPNGEPEGQLNLENQVSRAAVALSLLPRETILRHRDDLDWLSKQETLRVEAKEVLPRYADFGADGIPSLLWLIDDAHRFRETNGKAWQHPYLAGLIGLCKLGAEGSAAIQPLIDRLDSGAIVNFGMYNRLLVHALVRMGAKPDLIWPHIQKKGQFAAKDVERERKDFVREVERALRREECRY